MDWRYTELISSIRATSDPFRATGINAFGNDEIIEGARAHIDKELRLLSGAAIAMQELKYRRNTLALVSRLPPEILSEIFIMFRALTSRTLDGEERFSPRELSWITATHICRYWREVAINTPTLWNDIDATKPQWALEMLGRSKLAPIDITASPVSRLRNDINLDRSLLLAIGHISRTRNLHIRASFRIVGQVLSSMTAAAPALESLALVSVLGQSPIPACIFNCKVPRLRYLTVESCDGFWNLPLENLTELSIRFPDGRSMSISPEEFLKKVSIMPLLETLDVMNYWNPRFRQESITSSDHIIPLRSLRKFTVVSEICHCALLMRSISFPSTASVKLQSSDYSSRLELHHSTILSVLEQQYGRETDGDPWLTVHISFDPFGELRFRFQAWTICCSDDEVLENEEAALDISSTCSGLVGEDVRVIKALCSLRPLGQVGILKLENFQLPNTCAVEILMGFQAVHTLRMADEPTYPLIWALITHKPDARNRSQEGSSILLPNLHTMEFKGSDLAATHCEFLDRQLHLQEFLIKKRRRKVNLKLLRLQECRNVNEADVDRMKKFVDMVEWDGLEDVDGDDQMRVLFSRQESVEI